jgi:hypothetical protein
MQQTSATALNDVRPTLRDSEEGFKTASGG